MYDLVLKNCTIVNEKSIFESDIAIKNDRIESIASDISTEAKEIIDLNGKYVFPGFIDDQVHFREPGLTHKGDIASESFAGLAGGVTSYFEMPNVNPTTTTLENLDKKFELAKQRSFSNYSFYLGASNTNIEEIKKIKKVCVENNLNFHLDGARIWNAYVSNGVKFKEYGKVFDTISVCLSKGLGCPVGSVLLCSKEKYDEALRFRKIFGGGMRQSGYLAACGIYALKNNINRLAEDHKRAFDIGKKLKTLSFIREVEDVESNIVIFEIDEKIESQKFLDELNKNGILIISMGDNKLRVVTHIDYTEDQHQYFLNLLDKLNF